METDREIALAWWTSGRMKLCQYDTRQKYYPNKKDHYLTDDEVFEVWKKETNPKLQETVEQAANNYYNKHNHPQNQYCREAFLAGVKWREVQK